MLAWISQHSDALLVIVNVGVLLVWVFYAQLLLSSVLKQRRARVLINEVKGRDLDAEIMVANMSDEKIFIQLLLAVVHSDDQEFTHAITDVYTQADDDTEQPAQRFTSQGPLDPSGTMRLGSFRHIARQVSPGSGGGTQWQSLEIRLVFFRGNKRKAVAAIRTFRFEDDDDSGARYVVPDTPDTALHRRVWHGRKIQRWLRDYG